MKERPGLIKAHNVIMQPQQKFLVSQIPLTEVAYPFEKQRDKLLEEINELSIEASKSEINFPDLLSESRDNQQAVSNLLYAHAIENGLSKENALLFVITANADADKAHKEKMDLRVIEYDGLSLVME